MVPLAHGVRVFVCTQPTDMRKSFDGLIAATRSVMGQSPLGGHLFVFVNRSMNLTKALYWSKGGFCIWSKRLEAGRFARIGSIGIEGNAAQITDTQLMMWIDGIELLGAAQRKRFKLPTNAAASEIIAA